MLLRSGQTVECSFHPSPSGVKWCPARDRRTNGGTQLGRIAGEGNALLRHRLLRQPDGFEGLGAIPVMIAASAVTSALVGAAPASAQNDSFTFGDADVIGPVHIRGRRGSGALRGTRTRSAITSGFRPSRARRVPLTRSLRRRGFGRYHGRRLVTEPSRRLHLRRQAAYPATPCVESRAVQPLGFETRDAEGRMEGAGRLAFDPSRRRALPKRFHSTISDPLVRCFARGRSASEAASR